MGRAYLAALPEKERKAIFARARPGYGDDWPEVEAKALEAIAMAQERGYALSGGDWVSEARSAGVAIRRPNGYPVYAINVGGLRSIITRRAAGLRSRPATRGRRAADRAGRARHSLARPSPRAGLELAQP